MNINIRILSKNIYINNEIKINEINKNIIY